MPDYIPGSDSEFNNWQSNFINYLTNNAGNMGLVPEDLAPLTAAQSSWQTAYNDLIAAEAALSNAREHKNDTRQNYESSLRATSQRLQVSADVTDADRAALGLTIRDTVRTAAGVPTTRPLATIESSDRLQHKINFVDEDSPTRRAKPDGVLGCEIWVKIGDAPPTSPDELRFLGLDTATPYTAKFNAEDANKTAYYMLRWTNRSMEAGPWSETVGAFIRG